MKKNLFMAGCLGMLTALIALAVSCNPLHDPDSGNGDNLRIDITKLDFDQSLVVGVPGGLEPTLTLTRFPAHNTMLPNSVYLDYDSQIAKVEFEDEQCTKVKVSVVPGAITDMKETTVRAVYKDNNSVFAEATLMVLPDWPRERTLNFTDAVKWPSTVSNTTIETALTAMGAKRTDSGDWDMGNGVFFLLGTGSAGVAARAGDTDEKSVLEIDPENPYELGIIPLGGPPSLNASPVNNGGNFEGFYEVPSDPDNGFVVVENGSADRRHLRTAGDAARLFRIMGLQRPFEIVVKYRANGGGTRWVDLRFGDTTGLRVEGPVSATNGTDQGRLVRFLWDKDEDGNPRDDFVPFVFVELIGGMQIYAIEVIDKSL